MQLKYSEISDGLDCRIVLEFSRKE